MATHTYINRHTMDYKTMCDNYNALTEIADTLIDLLCEYVSIKNDLVIKGDNSNADMLVLLNTCLCTQKDKIFSLRNSIFND